MRAGETIIRVAWVLIGLLVAAAGVFFLSAPPGGEAPYSSSFDPSGSAAFAELLRREGYEVALSESIPLEMPMDRTFVAFVDREELPKPIVAPKVPLPRSVIKDFQANPSVVFLTKYLQQGGKAIVLAFDSLKDLKPEARSTWDVTDSAKHKFKVTGIAPMPAVHLLATDASFSAWLTTGGSPCATLDAVGKGHALVVPNGELAMNEFIGEADDAKLLVQMMRAMAPAGSKIEILDGAISGGAPAGLLDALGPWSYGMRDQFAILAVVIVFSLGKRFGLAEATRRRQPSVRDLLDGIADTYERGKSAKAAVQQLVKDADRAVRRKLKLPADAAVRKRNELLPEALGRALVACEQALMQELRPADALELVRRLDTELELFMVRTGGSAIRQGRRVKSA